MPINIYIIGDWQGVGVQFAFFRYQITTLGTSLIHSYQDIEYIKMGILGIKTALSTAFWIIGSIFLTISFIYQMLYLKKFFITGLFVLFSSILYLVSIIIQYGPLFHGPAGTAIPIGLPVLFVIGAWMYMEGQKEEAGDEEEEV
ncbi:MAG: hypothetical protein MUF37_01750 [Methanoregulaceae archaeon]|nr:hypothetical protein [Methanoregulaceae archaeon]